MKFADWLLAKLAEEDWTQKKLADKSGLSKQAITNYVNGRIPDKHAMRKIASAFRMKPEEVYRVAMGNSQNPEIDPWVEDTAYKVSLLPPVFRDIVDKFIDSLLEGQEDNKAAQTKPKKSTAKV